MQRDLSELKLDTRTARVTSSFGLGELLPGDIPDAVLKRADVSLYRANTDGRNCIAPASKKSAVGKRARRFREQARLSPDLSERRWGQPASDGLIARVCAVIDLPIASGFSEEVAAQLLARKMISAGIPFPKNTQSKKWDNYLVAWRTAFREGIAKQRCPRRISQCRWGDQFNPAGRSRGLCLGKRSVEPPPCHASPPASIEKLT